MVIILKNFVFISVRSVRFVRFAYREKPGFEILDNFCSGETDIAWKKNTCGCLYFYWYDKL